MNLIYRRYELDDLLECAKELKLAFKDAPWNEDWTIEQAMERISVIMDSHLSRGFVCIDEDTNEVIGIMLGRLMPMLDKLEYWIDDFSTNPRIQGLGVGTNILEYAKKSLKEEFDNINSFNLITRKGYPCYDYYEKKGFINDGVNTYLHLDV